MAQEPIDEFDLTPLLGRQPRRRAVGNAGPANFRAQGGNRQMAQSKLPADPSDPWVGTTTGSDSSTPEHTQAALPHAPVAVGCPTDQDAVLLAGLSWAVGGLAVLAFLAVASVGYLVMEHLPASGNATRLSAGYVSIPTQTEPSGIEKPFPPIQRVRPASLSGHAPSRMPEMPRPAHLDAEGNCSIKGQDPAGLLQACLTWFNEQV